MSAVTLLVAGLALMAAGYFVYSRFIAQKILKLDPNYETPSHAMQDGIDYVPTNKYVLWGHHFTSVAGAAPIVGPAIAVIWGWLPAFVWVVCGTIFIAGVHDMSAVWASVRNRGLSIGAIAGRVVNGRTRSLFMVVIFLLLLMLRDIYPVLGLNSALGLIAIYLGGALGGNTFLIYGFFNTIPKELDEAARIDGASHAQIFWGVIMRLVTPILVVVGLLSFVSSYGDFILAKIVLQRPEDYTLAVGMYVWASDERNAPWSLYAAGAVVAATPIILLFMYLQKYIVAGLTAGAVKG